MMRKGFALGLAGIAVAGAGAVFTFNTSSAAFIDPSDAARVARGKDIYMTHCASCHGASLVLLPDGAVTSP